MFKLLHHEEEEVNLRNYVLSKRRPGTTYATLEWSGIFGCVHRVESTFWMRNLETILNDNPACPLDTYVTENGTIHVDRVDRKIHYTMIPEFLTSCNITKGMPHVKMSDYELGVNGIPGSEKSRQYIYYPEWMNDIPYKSKLPRRHIRDKYRP